MVSMVLQRLTAKRVHFCMAGASIDISEEMIKSSILERFQIMMFLRYFFITTSSAFCFLYFYLFFFFWQSSVQNRGACYTRARIIHW